MNFFWPIWVTLVVFAIAALTAVGINLVHERKVKATIVAVPHACEDAVIVLAPGRYRMRDLCHPHQYTVFDAKGIVRCVCDRSDAGVNGFQELYDTDDCTNCVDVYDAGFTRP